LHRFDSGRRLCRDERERDLLGRAGRRLRPLRCRAFFRRSSRRDQFPGRKVKEAGPSRRPDLVPRDLRRRLRLIADLHGDLGIERQGSISHPPTAIARPEYAKLLDEGGEYLGIGFCPSETPDDDGPRFCAGGGPSGRSSDGYWSRQGRRRGFALMSLDLPFAACCRVAPIPQPAPGRPPGSSPEFPFLTLRFEDRPEDIPAVVQTVAGFVSPVWRSAGPPRVTDVYARRTAGR
jgi:hypothetical protein